MPEFTSIVFNEGVSRLERSKLEAPYNIRNVRIHPFGEVRVLRNGTVLVGDDCPEGPKPWFWFNNEWITGARSIVSGDQYKDRLYASNYDDQILEKHQLDGQIIGEPALVTFVDNTENYAYPWSSDTFDIEGITLGFAADYIIIPYNEHGEAGKWGFFTVEAVNDPGSGDVQTNVVGLEIHTLGASWFEVYRTVDYELEADWRYLFDAIGVRKQQEGLPTSGFHFEDKVPVSDQKNTFGENVTNFRSSVYWPLGIEKEDQGLADALGPVLQRGRNLWSTRGQSGTFTYLAPVAKTMFNHAGRMLYGNIKAPTKEPYGLSFDFAGGSPKIAAQLEYETPLGPVYGPFKEFGQPTRAMFYWQGEDAINIFFDDGGTWVLLERIEPNHDGRYVSGFQDEGSTNGVGTHAVTYIDEAPGNFSSSEAPTVGPFTDSDFVELPNLVLMSAQNRPYEVTYAGFVVPNSTNDGDSEVVAISAARLDEEESLSAYQFYVLTNRDVYVVNRDDTLATLDLVIKGVGCKRGNDDWPLAIPVTDGICFAGTNDHVYFLSGRQFRKLDFVINDVPSHRKLFTNVRDITYNVDENELQVATETGIWCYDFDQEGWFTHRDFRAYEEIVGDPGDEPPDPDRIKTAPYDISAFWDSEMESSTEILRHVLVREVEVSDVVIDANGLSALPMAFSVKLNDVTIGQVTYAGGSSFWNAGTFNAFPGDVITITSPANVSAVPVDYLVYLVAEATYVLPPGLVLQTQTEAYDVSAFYEGQVGSNIGGEVLRFVAPRAVSVEEIGMRAEAPYAGNSVFQVLKNGAIVDTITWDNGQDEIVKAVSIELAQGDRLVVKSPSFLVTLNNVNIWYKGTTTIAVVGEDDDDDDGSDDDSDENPYLNQAHIQYWFDRRGTIINEGDEDPDPNDDDEPGCILWDGTGFILPIMLVETQRLRTVARQRVSEIRVDYEALSRTLVGNGNAGTNMLRITEGFSHFEDRLGFVYLSNAGLSYLGEQVELQSIISQVLGLGTFVISDYFRQNFNGSLTLLRPASARFITRSTGNKRYVQQFVMPPHRVRYPKAYGRHHQIRIKDFETLREIGILSDAQLYVF